MSTASPGKNSDIISLYPSQLEICLSEECNFDCDYCFMNKSCLETLSFERARKGIEHFLSRGGKSRTITFNSGEPLLNFDVLKKVIDYSLSRSEELGIRLNVVVTTNCLLLDRERFDYFSRDRRLMLNISLDGAKESHDRHRKIRGKGRVSSFDTIWKNMVQLPKGDVRVIATITPENIPHLSDNLRFLLNKGFRKFDFFPQMFKIYNKSQLDELEEQIKQLNSTVSREKSAGTEIDIFWLNRLWGRTCYNKVLLGSDGKFYLFDAVTILPYDERKGYAVGDIDSGIEYRKRKELFKSIIEDAHEVAWEKCSSCKLDALCFVPLPLYIWCKSNGKVFKDYLAGFCEIARVFISAYLYRNEVENER